MSSYSLTAKPLLGGYAQTIGNTLIEEVDDLSIVSIAIPAGGKEQLAKAMTKVYLANFPEPGKSTLSKDRQVRFLGMASDQLFALFTYSQDDGDFLIAKKLAKAGYYTLQSDNWLVLRIVGPQSIAALARICQLDLDSGVFPINSVGRTIMEHIGTTLVRESEESFLMLSPSSTAHSFLHAVQCSLENVL